MVAMIQNLALENPDLDADDPVGGLGDGIAVIDVGAQGLQGHPAIPVPFGAGDLGPGQPAGAGDLDALGPELAGQPHGPLHDVQKTFMNPHLELFTGLLVHVHGAVDRHLMDVRGQRNGPGHAGTRVASGIHDFGHRLVQDAVVVGLEFDTNTIVLHDADVALPLDGCGPRHVNILVRLPPVMGERLVGVGHVR